MELRVPRAVLERISRHARETYPEECCGFLIGSHDGANRTVIEERRAVNVSPDSRLTQYQIDNEVTRRTEHEFRVGPLRIVGFYHSHPESPAVPTEQDSRMAWPYYIYAILAVKVREPSDLTAWRLDDETRKFEAVAVTID